MPIVATVLVAVLVAGLAGVLVAVFVAVLAALLAAVMVLWRPSLSHVQCQSWRQAAVFCGIGGHMWGWFASGYSIGTHLASFSKHVGLTLPCQAPGRWAWPRRMSAPNRLPAPKNFGCHALNQPSETSSRSSAS